MYLNYVRGGDAGITAAGVALYSQSGHRFDLVSLGDMTWDQVPNEQRSEMDCGGFQHGVISRAGAFSVNEFPYYLGLWFSEIHAGAPEGQTMLEYNGNMPPETPVALSDWKSVRVESPYSFPPLPDSSPELGVGITAGEMISYDRACRKRNLTVHDVHCCDIGISGWIESSNPHYLPGLRRAQMKEDGETALVEVAIRDFQRPPERHCETMYLEYTVGLSFSEGRPTSFEVVHLDSHGEELERNQVTSRQFEGSSMWPKELN
ncbi:hypothetical protein [Haladaptatus sp. NG-SE-30]